MFIETEGEVKPLVCFGGLPSRSEVVILDAKVSLNAQDRREVKNISKDAIRDWASGASVPEISRESKELQTTTPAETPWYQGPAVAWGGWLLAIVAIGVSIYVGELPRMDRAADEHVKDIIQQADHDISGNIAKVNSTLGGIQGELKILEPLVVKQISEVLRKPSQDSLSRLKSTNVNPDLVRQAGLR